MNLLDNGNPTEYADIFVKRGHLYNAAMASAKTARDFEFKQLFSKHACGDKERIIDAPSGGAYLQDFLQRTLPSREVEMINLEFTPGFSNTPELVTPYNAWPIRPQWADRSICLAASHHIQNLEELLNNFYHHTRPGGLIHLADVVPNSGISEFLDGFVNQHTSTGHRGIYRSFQEYNWPSWMEIQCIEIRPCPWIFCSEEQMLEFCYKLFGLNHSAKSTLCSTLNKLVGLSKQDNEITLNWQLAYLDAVRK